MDPTSTVAPEPETLDESSVEPSRKRSTGHVQFELDLPGLGSIRFGEPSTGQSDTVLGADLATLHDK